MKITTYMFVIGDDVTESRKQYYMYGGVIKVGSCDGILSLREFGMAFRRTH